MKSDAHVWSAHNWISPVLLSHTETFHLPNHARLLYSRMLQHSQLHVLGTNFSHFFYLPFKLLLEFNLFCEELPDSPEDSMLPSCMCHGSLY